MKSQFAHDSGVRIVKLSALILYCLPSSSVTAYLSLSGIHDIQVPILPFNSVALRPTRRTRDDTRGCCMVIVIRYSCMYNVECTLRCVRLKNRSILFN